MILDTEAQSFFDKNINLMVPWYLMAAWAYYKEDDPILSDHFFDSMANIMLNKWDDIEHSHKHLLRPTDLMAGTYLGQYPNRVKDALAHLRSIHKGKHNGK
jgi:NAD-dependent DNA ligase